MRLDSHGRGTGPIGIGLLRTPGLVVSPQGRDAAAKTLDRGYCSWLQKTDEWTVTRLNAVADGLVGSVIRSLIGSKPVDLTLRN